VKAQAEVAQKQAQVEGDKVELMQKQLEMERKAMAEGADLALRHEEMTRHDDLERDKLDADIALRAKELELKYSAEVSTAEIQAAVDRDRAKLEADTKLETAKIGKKVTIAKAKEDA
jgi:hypothetical protein